MEVKNAKDIELSAIEMDEIMAFIFSEISPSPPSDAEIAVIIPVNPINVPINPNDTVTDADNLVWFESNV